MVHFIWFTDEKMFTVVASNSAQNDCLYVTNKAKNNQVPAARLLRTPSSFSKSMMVSVDVCSLGATALISVEQGVQINGAYYRGVLLSQNLPPAIRDHLGDFFIFQQDSPLSTEPNAQARGARFHL